MHLEDKQWEGIYEKRKIYSFTPRQYREKNFPVVHLVSQLSSSVPWPYPENGVEWFLNNIVLSNQGKDRWVWVWGIFLKDNPAELIGVVDLWRKGVPEHRGIWLGEPFWGRGIMTEAVEPITDYAFNYLGFVGVDDSLLSFFWDSTLLTVEPCKNYHLTIFFSNNYPQVHLLILTLFLIVRPG